MNRRRISRPPIPPMGAVGMVFLVAIMEFVIAGTARFTSEKSASWSFASRAAARDAIDADVIILGDSMVKFGVLPPVIEARNRGRAFNLALFDGPPLASLALLEQLTANGAQPRALVINLMPHQLARDVLDRKHSGMWRLLMDFATSCRLAWRFQSPGLPLDVVWSSAFPSLAARDGIRASIEAALIQKERSTQAVINVYTNNWKSNQGAHLLAERSEPGRFSKLNHELFPSDWRPDRANLAIISEILNTARQRNIQVFWLISPLHPEAEQALLECGVTSRYSALIASFQRSFPELTVLDARSIGIEAEDFVDAVHLDRKGAIALSESISRALSVETNGGRVKLTRVTHSLAAPAMQDIGESRLAAGREHRARR